MHRDGTRLLELLIFNEEFLVSAGHQLVPITSLPFVHTARRSYRLSDPVNNLDCGELAHHILVESLVNLRGRRSRNKVSVGEPAEGSFEHIIAVTSKHDVSIRTIDVCRFHMRLTPRLLHFKMHTSMDDSRFYQIPRSGKCLDSSIAEGHSELRFTQ